MVFGPDGALERTTPVPADLEGHRFPSPTGTFADGRILAQSGAGSERGRRETFDGTFLVLTGNAGLGSVIGTRPSGMCGGVDDCRIGAFQPYASLLPGDSTVFYAFPRSYEIRELARDGRTLRIIRKAGQAIPLAPESLDRVIAGISERSGQTEEAIRERLDAQLVPEAMPAFERALVDPSGHLWVSEYEAVVPVLPLYGNDSFRWSATAPLSVFDPSGRWLGTVRIPSDLRVLDIAEDFVVGLHTDEFDLETIRVLALRKQQRQDE